MQTIELEQAKAKFGELLDQVVAGEVVIITRDLEPIVKLISIKRQRRARQAGSARGQITIADDFDAPLEEFKEYM